MKKSLQPSKTSTTKSARSAHVQEKDERFTGRHIIMLDKTVKSTVVERAAGKVSLRMANLRDFKSASTPMAAVSKALSQADGVVFEKLKVAVVKDPGRSRMNMMAAMPLRVLLNAEPERYVYALAKRSLVRFDDDDIATWGIHAMNVMRSSLSGKGVRIAILDTGLNLKHPDFKGRKITSKSFAGQAVEDGEGHGSHCCGIAAGNISRQKGFRYGVANKAEIFVGKVLDNNGEGEDNFVLAGIEWALENKCKVISMSLGSSVKPGETYYTSYETVAARALQQGTIIVAAAGNDSYRKRGIIKPVNHPANCPSIVCVAAVDKNYAIADFSCAGSRLKGNEVNLAAPGVDIFSSSKKGGYEILSGTSMATPFVSGLTALLWEQNPRASAKVIWQKLVKTVKHLNLNKSDAGAGFAFLP